MIKNRTWMVFVGVSFLLLLVAAEKKFHFFSSKKLEAAVQDSLNVAPHKKEVEAELFLVQASSFSDILEGLIGTVKGDTVELAFTGSQEESIISISVRVGQVVERGQVLLELDHTRSASRKSQAQSAYDRAKNLFDVGGATPSDVRDAKATLDIAMKDYQDTFIRAPQRGYISQISRQVGESVGRNEPLIVLVGTENKLYLETGVNESQIEKIKAGQLALVKIDALADVQEIQGQVLGTSREVSVTGRSGTVQISLPDTLQKRLRPGLSAQCKIVCFQFDQALVIPSESYDHQKNGVYVVQNSSAIFKPVEIGYARRDYYQVLAGLLAGDRVVASLVSYPVEDGAKVLSSREDLKYQP